MTKLHKSTPRKDGFRMPGEFENHSSTWILWPVRPDVWRLGAKPAQKVFTKVASAISRFEPVTMGVLKEQFIHARSVLPPEIRVVEMSYDDAWVRDCGPTCVVDAKKDARGVNWKFNAWGGLNGGLYFPWDLDDLVAWKISEIENFDQYRAPIVIEGGSLHVDGKGTLLTTEECLLNPNRNPNLSKQEIESLLCEYLNIKKIIWLKRGVYFDETSGHVDNLCCFIDEGKIALTWTEDKQDPQYDISNETYEILMRSTDANGNRFKVTKINQPLTQCITEEESLEIDQNEGSYPRNPGDRLAASYINFYICNGGVIVPTFNDPNDIAALSTIQELFPNRKVVGIFARDLLLGGGNIHCITQQMPYHNKATT